MMLLATGQRVTLPQKADHASAIVGEEQSLRTAYAAAGEHTRPE
jgi:hypothetical protein